MQHQPDSGRNTVASVRRAWIVMKRVTGWRDFDQTHWTRRAAATRAFLGRSVSATIPCRPKAVAKSEGDPELGAFRLLR
jgi:hypothetical protein